MNKLQYLNVSPDKIGKYVLLTETKEQAKAVADLFGAQEVPSASLFGVYSGKLGEECVSVVACGIGSPAFALVIEELANCSVTTVIRVGHALPLLDNSKEGDIVLASGGVKMDGTCAEYVVPDFPSVANFVTLCALEEAAAELLGKENYRIGIVEGRDVVARRRDYDRTLVSGSNILEKAFQRGSVLCSDLETAAVLVVSRYFRIRGASVDLVTSSTDPDLKKCGELALKAVCLLMEKDAQNPDDPCYLT